MRIRLGKGIGLRFFEDANQTKGNSKGGCPILSLASIPWRACPISRGELWNFQIFGKILHKI